LPTPPLRPGHTYYLGFWSPVDTTFSVSSSTSGGPVVVTNTIAYYDGTITNVIPGYGSLVYRMDVPPEATRIAFSAGNSTNVVLSLEQGTMAQPGGPAHWTSFLYNNSQYGNQANASFNQSLRIPDNWPWLPGYSYYLAITNTSPDPESFGFTMANPADLLALAFTAPPTVTSTRPNPQIEIVWGVTNQGIGSPPGGWYDRVWFSANGVLDANSISLGDFGSGQTLSAGGSYWRTNIVTLPMSGSGSYTLFVQSDIYDWIYESNEVNNVSAPVSGSFTLTPLDLMPVSVVAPATVFYAQSNPAITVNWGVTNQGLGSATGGWYDRIWFSTNGVLDANSVGLGDFYFNQGVPAGGNYSQTNSVRLPVSGIGGYTLFVQVDIYGWIYESNETNNISAPVTVTLLPPNGTTLTGVLNDWSGSDGNSYQQAFWNTCSGDFVWDIFITVNSGAAGPFINGPDDTTAGPITVDLSSPGTYTFVMYAEPATLANADLNLFFNGNNNTPRISVKSPTDSVGAFSANSALTTYRLSPLGFNDAVPAAGTLSFIDGTNQISLVDYRWYNPDHGDIDLPVGDRVSPTTAQANGSADARGLFTLQVTPFAPQLTINRSESNVILTWPTNAAGFTLQSPTNLAPAVWSSVSPTPVVVNGQNAVTNPVSGTQKFFRLSR